MKTKALNVSEVLLDASCQPRTEINGVSREIETMQLRAQMRALMTDMSANQGNDAIMRDLARQMRLTIGRLQQLGEACRICGAYDTPLDGIGRCAGRCTDERCQAGHPLSDEELGEGVCWTCEGR